MKHLSCVVCKHCVKCEIDGMVKNMCELSQKSLTRREVRHFICSDFKHIKHKGLLDYAKDIKYLKL